MRHPIITATLVAGTLDILSAFVFASMAGTTAGQVLRFVASGPFGDGALAGGAGWAAVGLAVHFAIMAGMAAAYVLAASRFPNLLRRPIVAGTAYGLLLWLIMYWLVMPLRWPDVPRPHDATAIAKQLLSHVVLVGIPIALIAARSEPRRGTRDAQ